MAALAIGRGERLWSPASDGTLGRRWCGGRQLCSAAIAANATDRIVRAALGTAIPEHRAAFAAEPFNLGIFRTAL
jgi:hypothetical protein